MPVFDHSVTSPQKREVYYTRNTLFVKKENSRYSDLIRDYLRFDLVAEAVHHARRRTYEFDSGILARLRKLGIFRQKTVPRMYGIHAFGLCKFNDLIYSEVGRNRRFSLSDLV